MNTMPYSTQAIEREVVNIIKTVTKVQDEDRLLQVRDLTKLGLDILDVVDIILEVEKIYNLTIPDEVPVYSVDDFVRYVYSQLIAKPERKHIPTRRL
ncbi:acyl carrier protein [Pontibacter toksunensis]|uniref:Acyl carrier protein n=1 Tax=Pontibacter toksunensis TaxID=1332631 RepID=A0ABW6BWN8_9BACT